MAEVETWEVFCEIRKKGLLQRTPSTWQRRACPSPTAMPPGQEANATKKHLAVASWADQGNSLTFASLKKCTLKSAEKSSPVNSKCKSSHLKEQESSLFALNYVFPQKSASCTPIELRVVMLTGHFR